MFRVCVVRRNPCRYGLHLVAYNDYAKKFTPITVAHVILYTVNGPCII